MSDKDTLLTAADMIANEARAIRDCHTVRGQWPEGDEDVRQEVEKMNRVARDLRRIAKQLQEGV